MELVQDSLCGISGYQYWPEFYNSKAKLFGSQYGDSVMLEETSLLEGYHMFMTHEIRVTYSKTDTLILKYLDAGGRLNGTAELVRSTALPVNVLNKFNELAKQKADHFGTAKFLDQPTSFTVEEIVRSHRDLYRGLEDSYRQFSFSGNASYGKLNMKLSGHYKDPGKYYFHLTLQGLEFLNVKNDSIAWNYNGMDDKVQIETDDQEEVILSQLGLDELDLKNYPIKEVRQVQLDSVLTYRVYLESQDKGWRTYFIDQQTYQILRKEDDSGIEYFLDYQNPDGIPFPGRVLDLSLDNYFSYSFDKIQFGVLIPDSVFDIPKHLKPKIEVSSARDHNHFDQLGESQYEAGDYQGALESCNSAIQLEPYTSYYLKRGQIQMELEDMYAAISDFTVVLGVEPDNQEALNYRGLAKYYLEDYKNALVDLNRSIELDSNFVEAINNRLYANYKIGNNTEALKDAEKLVALTPDDPEHHFLYAMLLANQEKYQQAVAHYQESISMGYQDGGIFNYKGVSHFALEQYDSAMVAFEQALKQDTANVQVLTNLANAYFKLDLYPETVEYLQKVLVIEPENHEMMNSLGYTLQFLEDYDESLSYLNQAIAIHDKDASYFDNRAETNYSLQRYEEALEDLNTSIDLYSEDARAYYRRGLVKVTMNNRYDACRDFKKAHDMGLEEASAQISEHCIEVKSGEQ